MNELHEKTRYTGFTILGKTEKEEDKLYASNHWMALFSIVDALFKSQHLHACVVSYQQKHRVKKIDKKGRWHITAQKIATGGVQKWSEKANHKICSGEILLHFELMKRLSDEQSTLQAYIGKHFPEIDTYYFFLGTEIFAYLDAHVNVKHQPQPDFHLQLHNTLNPINEVWDQEINILVSERLWEKCAPELEHLITSIGVLGHAVSIARADFQYQKLIDTGLGMAVSSIVGKRFGDINTLALRQAKDLQLSDWVTI